MELNFKNAKKTFLTVELESGTYHLPSPKRGLLRRMTAMTKDVQVDELYDLALEILNTNIEGGKFKAKDVDESFDVMDIKTLLAGYTEFVTAVMSAKN